MTSLHSIKTCPNKRKEKSTLVGVHLLRSQVLYRPAQATCPNFLPAGRHHSPRTCSLVDTFKQLTTSHSCAQAATTRELTSYCCAAGKESSMSSLKARMVALKKGMGIGTADIKGTKLPHAAAATNAGAIQQHLALVIHVRCFSLLTMRLLPRASCIFVLHLVLTHDSHTLFSQHCTEHLTLLDHCMSSGDAKAVAAFALHHM